MTAAPNTFNAINGTGAVHPAHLDGTFAVKVREPRGFVALDLDESWALRRTMLIPPYVHLAERTGADAQGRSDQSVLAGSSGG